jgi:hypothetical protein
MHAQEMLADLGLKTWNYHQAELTTTAKSWEGLW